MRRIETFLCLFIIVLLLQFCKSSDPTPVTPVGTPEITEQGTPFGDVASASIGSAGGTITSADGLVTLDVPVGALDANTTISIQPITNTAPLGVSGMAYRFSPDGQIFKKPAKLTFNYTPDLLDSTSAEFLWIVTQDKDGSWLALTNSNVDTVAQTLSGEISHFSDWGAGKAIDLKLDPSSATLLIGQSVRLSIRGFSDLGSSEGGLARLTHAEAAENDPSFNPLLPSAKGKSKFKFIGWGLSGQGTLNPKRWFADYTAPRTIPSRNPVAVSLQLERYDYATDKPVSIFKNISLVSNISITEAGVLVINFKGKQYLFKQFESNNNIIFVTDNLRLIGLIPDASGFGPYFEINRSLTSTGSYTHVCSESDPLKDNVSYVDADLNTLYDLKWCEPNPGLPCIKHCARFVSNINKWTSKLGETITGTFSGHLYDRNGNLFPITGNFNLVRTG